MAWLAMGFLVALLVWLFATACPECFTFMPWTENYRLTGGGYYKTPVREFKCCGHIVENPKRKGAKDAEA